MSDGKGAPSTPPSTPARFPSQYTPPKSAADKAAFAAVSYTRIPASATEPLSERGQAALDRLVDVLAPAPLPTETASRRRVMNVRGW